MVDDIFDRVRNKNNNNNSLCTILKHSHEGVSWLTEIARISWGQLRQFFLFKAIANMACKGDHKHCRLKVLQNFQNLVLLIQEVETHLLDCIIIIIQ